MKNRIVCLPGVTPVSVLGFFVRGFGCNLGKGYRYIKVSLDQVDLQPIEFTELRRGHRVLNHKHDSSNKPQGWMAYRVLTSFLVLFSIVLVKLCARRSARNHHLRIRAGEPWQCDTYDLDRSDQFGGVEIIGL